MLAIGMLVGRDEPLEIGGATRAMSSAGGCGGGGGGTGGGSARMPERKGVSAGSMRGGAVYWHAICREGQNRIPRINRDHRVIHHLFSPPFGVVNITRPPALAIFVVVQI